MRIYLKYCQFSFLYINLLIIFRILRAQIIMGMTVTFISTFLQLSGETLNWSVFLVHFKPISRLNDFILYFTNWNNKGLILGSLPILHLLLQLRNVCLSMVWSSSIHFYLFSRKGSCLPIDNLIEDSCWSTISFSLFKSTMGRRFS